MSDAKLAAAELLDIDYDTFDSILALAVHGGVSPAATVRAIGIDVSVVDRVVCP